MGVTLLLLGTSAVAAPGAKPASGAAAKQACVAAHEQAQTLRTDKKLHAARERYVACARVECPVVLRKECTEQIAQMEEAAPTIVLEALDDTGASDTSVRVTLDGEPLSGGLTGTAVPVEPGEHVLRFERASDKKVLEHRVLVVEGEKNRKVVADFQTLAPKPVDAEAGPPSAGPPPPHREARVPALTWVAAGVGVVGFGSFAFFSLSGRSAEDDLSERCAPSCRPADVSPVKRDYLIADVSLAVGIVATAVAVVLALPALRSDSSAAALRAAPALGPPPWLPRRATSRAVSAR